MSWGSNATSGASNTPNVASASLGGTNYTSTAADTIGNTSNTVGPTVEAAQAGADYSGMSAPNVGPQQPTFVESLRNTYDKFKAGEDSSFMDMMSKDKFGNNPETYGYLYSLSKYGKAPQSTQAPNINVRYEQPDNPYLRKRGY